MPCACLRCFVFYPKMGGRGGGPGPAPKSAPQWKQIAIIGELMNEIATMVQNKTCELSKWPFITKSVKRTCFKATILVGFSKSFFIVSLTLSTTPLNESFFSYSPRTQNPLQSNKKRISHGGEKIWILYSSGKNNISRVSAENNWDIVLATRTKNSYLRAKV